MDCLFCKITNGEVPANIIYSDENVTAFEDIHPQAPHHIIIIPRKHIATLNDLQTEDNPLLGHMIKTAAQIAGKLNLAEKGYRIAMNCNEAGGQTVFHIHLHLLGGRQMTWPPG